MGRCMGAHPEYPVHPTMSPQQNPTINKKDNDEEPDSKQDKGFGLNLYRVYTE